MYYFTSIAYILPPSHETKLSRTGIRKQRSKHSSCVTKKHSRRSASRKYKKHHISCSTWSGKRLLYSISISNSSYRCQSYDCFARKFVLLPAASTLTLRISTHRRKYKPFRAWCWHRVSHLPNFGSFLNYRHRMCYSWVISR
jgi:hypothetical protein